MKDSKELIRAIEKLRIHDHLCLIYESREEQFAAVIPFIRIGLEKGEKCIYIADDNTSAQVLGEMIKGGINTDAVIKSGALSMLTKKEAYLKYGYFNADWMVQYLKKAAEGAKSAGYSALRVTGEMTWVLGNEPGSEQLIEYEAKLNYHFPENDVLALCQYNRARFRPEIILDVIRTHPIVIYGGMVCRNFYYVPPDELLKPEQKSQEIERLLHNIAERANLEGIRATAERELRKSNQVLKEALDKVKLLSGLLPICAACKKIRNGKGSWVNLEKYISEHSAAEFSHSVCPECAAELYPEYKDALK
ncbi:MAG: MEDS domain-containing protein [Deltaproteobacteria bacterium]|nr:MEDS domain-containing protein [Deltaproteobacteria bacterium]